MVFKTMTLSRLTTMLTTSNEHLRLGFVLIVVWVSGLYLGANTGLFHREKHVPNDAKTCTFPFIDAFDPNIEAYFKYRKPPLNCTNGVPNIVYLESGNILKVDPVAVKTMLARGEKLHSCQYNVLKINPDSNDTKTLIAMTRGPFIDTMQVNPSDEEIRVECMNIKGKVISKSWFAFVRPKPKTIKMLDSKLKTHQQRHKPAETFSILMLGIDAFSKQHFARSMPKTRDFLINEFKALEMKKHNRIGYCTLENIAGLLAGKALDEFKLDPKYRFKYDSHFDKIMDAFIWSEAQNLGYRTALALDRVKVTSFHWEKLGFKKRPVDHYLRSIVVDSEDDAEMRPPHKKTCYGDTPEVQKMFEYWLQLVSHYNSTRSTRAPFFAYGFECHLTHSDYNMAYAGDELYLEALKKLKRTNALNNTVVVWFSDHGQRFGSLMNTFQGMVESNTPYLFFIFPPWFEKKYPELMRVFKINQNRLTSHFDTWATMRDLLYFTGQLQPKGTLDERAISLFREIPEDRMCNNAGIPPTYCVCARFSNVNVSATMQRYLGLSIENKLDEVLKPHYQLCKTLKVKSVQSVLEQRDASSQSLWGYKTYRVRVITEPGNAVFEATINYIVAFGSAEVMGEVVRTNMYRGQADCIHLVEIKQYCYCKSLTQI